MECRDYYSLACSSSEVAATIEGVLRHCTEMSVEKNDVDTHGQCEARRSYPTGGSLTMP
jgi:TnpA family transposase